LADLGQKKVWKEQIECSAKWGNADYMGDSMRADNACLTPRGESSRCELCPLNRVRAGMVVRIKQLCAQPEVAHRLREIGLGEDRIVKLVNSSTNIICLVCNARLALSHHLAETILVEPLSAKA
jgi:Fe2+ transport system protein FeoA